MLRRLIDSRPQTLGRLADRAEAATDFPTPNANLSEHYYSDSVATTSPDFLLSKSGSFVNTMVHHCWFYKMIQGRVTSAPIEFLQHIWSRRHSRTYVCFPRNAQPIIGSFSSLSLDSVRIQRLHIAVGSSQKVSNGIVKKVMLPRDRWHPWRCWYGESDFLIASFGESYSPLPH